MNDFNECLEFSLGAREQFDFCILQSHIPKCERIEKTDIAMDKSGVDYIAHLRDGSTVTIDAKARKPGASRFWKNGEPDLALEQYSVCESKVVGWLFKDSNIHPDYILFTFDKSDCDKYYFIPFVLLQKAAWRNWKRWERQFQLLKQPNRGYHSSALFVPASIVCDAVKAVMIGAA